MVYKSRRLRRRPVSTRRPKASMSRPTRKRAPLRRAAPKRRLAPKKRASKRRKTASTAGGAIITGKPVSIPATGSCIRQTTYGEVDKQNVAWLGASSTGSEKFFMSVIAEAMIAKILRECKDYRSDKDAMVETGFSLVDTIQVIFARALVKEQVIGTDLQHKVVMDVLTDGSSFNSMVYNDQAVKNFVSLDGNTYPGVVPKPGWNRILYDQAIQGYFPVHCTVLKGAGGSPLQTMIYNDTQFGDMHVAMSVDGSHRFQNVTPANQPVGSTENNQYTDTNKNSISANPLSGKMYTFSNIAPKFNEGWLSRQGDQVIVNLNLNSGRPLGILDRTLGNDQSQVWNYAALSAYGAGSFPGTTMIPEFERPPLRSATVFSNVKTTTSIRMSPGAIQTFRTKFTYDGTLRRLLSSLTQVCQGGQSTPASPTAGKYPTLGDSFIMCLNPTMKTRPDELVSLGFQYTKIGKAFFTSKKGGYLPTTNLEFEA